MNFVNLLNVFVWAVLLFWWVHRKRPTTFVLAEHCFGEYNGSAYCCFVCLASNINKSFLTILHYAFTLKYFYQVKKT